MKRSARPAGRNGGGRSGCRCAARWGMGCGRSERTCRRSGRRVCCSAFAAITWSSCTGSSRKLGPRRMRIGNGAKAPEGVGAISKTHMGSSVDDFLKEEGIAGNATEDEPHPG
jgi:hypothetical protein